MLEQLSGTVEVFEFIGFFLLLIKQNRNDIIIFYLQQLAAINL
jgi:hypothetical protein